MSPATETFILETNDGLEELEAKLLALESAPTKDLIDDTFRILHTIKGSGSMFGFGPLARFTHQFETAFDLVREGKLDMSRTLIDTALAARDYMAQLLEANSDDDQIAVLEASETGLALTAAITALIDQGEGASEARTESATDNSAPAVADQARRVVNISFRPDPEALRNGMRPDLLLGELSELGTLTGTYDLSHVPKLEDLEPTTNHLGWNLKLDTAASLSELQTVFIFADDAELSMTDEPIAADAKAESAPKLSPDTESAGAVPTKTATDGSQPEAANQVSVHSDTVRVPSGRLDDVMDQLGELVIAQARLERLAEQSSDQALATIAEEIERLVTNLRDSSLSMRMLPIVNVFGKFRRVVRSLSAELGKEVDLETFGGETELDKSVIDSLTEPLVHMIRNSMDHGIESAEERVAKGKPARGKVILGARQSGGEVLITVRDDGRGLNTEAIRERAIERGLISADAPTPDADLHRMIFEPAFSTAKEVSSVSGRGVGMDAVQKVVTNLRGSIDVVTREGAGSEVTLKLPVTLAIIDGLLVRVGNGVFVLPLSSVSECVELSQVERQRRSGRTLLQIRDDLVPFLNLDELFSFPPSEEETRRVVIVSSEGKRIGLVVDDTLGQHQTVIKTFSAFHRNIKGLAGSTILGDGRVALIIDVNALIKGAQTAVNSAAAA